MKRRIKGSKFTRSMPNYRKKYDPNWAKDFEQTMKKEWKEKHSKSKRKPTNSSD